MADTYQNYPFPTMGSGWHGDMIAPQTLVNPSLASRTGTGIVGPTTGGNVIAGNQPLVAANAPTDLGLASRDPAFLQSIANRVLPPATPIAGGTTGGQPQMPSWLTGVMNGLSGMNFSGGGMGNQQALPPQAAPWSYNQSRFQAAQEAHRANADFAARVAAGPQGPNWGSTVGPNGQVVFAAPRPEEFGLLPQRQSGWM